MTSRLVRLQLISANDDSGKLVKWSCEDRAYVKSGDVIGVIESSKSALDVEAPMDGFCAHLRQVGERIPVGEPVAMILENVDQDPSQYLQAALAETTGEVRRWTKKAELTARKLGVDIAALSEELSRTVKESDVLGKHKAKPEVRDLIDDAYPQHRRERVLLIGGGAGGGAIAIDAISRTACQRAVAILDDNSNLHGKTALGVPVIGGNDMAFQLWRAGVFDTAIVAVTGDIDERQRLFEQLNEAGIPTTNVIDPSVQMRSNVQMGTGNLIMANTYLATCTTIGNNNFFGSHTCIEHHSVVGNHCTFGPRSTTSGAVTIGSRVKFGMGVLVEPYLVVGDDVLVPSGIIVTMSVPSGMVLKSQSKSVLRPRRD